MQCLVRGEPRNLLPNTQVTIVLIWLVQLVVCRAQEEPSHHPISTSTSTLATPWGRSSPDLEDVVLNINPIPTTSGNTNTASATPAVTVDLTPAVSSGGSIGDHHHHHHVITPTRSHDLPNDSSFSSHGNQSGSVLQQDQTTASVQTVSTSRPARTTVVSSATVSSVPSLQLSPSSAGRTPVVPHSVEVEAQEALDTIVSPVGTVSTAAAHSGPSEETPPHVTRRHESGRTLTLPLRPSPSTTSLLLLSLLLSSPTSSSQPTSTLPDFKTSSSSPPRTWGGTQPGLPTTPTPHPAAAAAAAAAAAGSQSQSQYSTTSDRNTTTTRPTETTLPTHGNHDNTGAATTITHSDSSRHSSSTIGVSVLSTATSARLADPSVNEGPHLITPTTHSRSSSISSNEYNTLVDGDNVIMDTSSKLLNSSTSDLTVGLEGPADPTMNTMLDIVSDNMSVVVDDVSNVTFNDVAVVTPSGDVWNQTSVLPPDEGSAGLSVGATIAISVACVLVVVSGVLVGLGILYHRHRSRKLDTTKAQSNHYTGLWDDNVTLSYINNHFDFFQKDAQDEMISLDNDAYLNSLEFMVFTNTWGDGKRNTRF